MRIRENRIWRCGENNKREVWKKKRGKGKELKCMKVPEVRVRRKCNEAGVRM